MTSETMRFLLKKLPKKMLIENIINVYETLFKTPEELKEAYHELALLIQAREVFLEKSKLESFSEPFRTEVEDFLKNWNVQSSASSHTLATTARLEE